MSIEFNSITEEDGPDTITILAEGFTEAAMEYHRREMGAKGYSLGGPIKPQTFFITDGMGEPTPLLEGKQYFAATFTRKK
ncbi:MAG: AMP nucleosidase [Alphaproteobacteria bacterium]|nr:AMP nucleosidase [Alphaproteobacteria bacterium SS10]